jgi:two-component system response regulator MprA
VPDVLVLDVAMPGSTGWRSRARLRAQGARAADPDAHRARRVDDRVAGLDAGADDYLVKPFAPEELLARIRALLRRGREPGEVLAHGDLVLDVRRAGGAPAGRELALSAREADLLELLLRNRGQVVTRELALERVWGGRVPRAERRRPLRVVPAREARRARR